ncbi:MAG: glutamyl-tRNA reductase, partial [Gemmatimonadaceae bacterium]
QRTLMAAAGAGASVIQGIATLSTCSRTELYAVARSPDEGLSALRTLMATHSGAPDEVIDRMRAVHGDAVVRHILRVSSGLESLMLGEHEILGQLREMLHRTVSAGTPGPLLHRLLECAIAAGARARTDTRIGQGHTTLGYAAAAAVSHAYDAPCAVPGLADGSATPRAMKARGHVVVIGAGRIGTQAALHLRGFGWEQIHIVNRSAPRARDVASLVGGTAHSLEELAPLLSTASAVVAAATVPLPLVTVELLHAARSPGAAPLTIVDLGNPRSVAPECGHFPNVGLHDLDHMGEVLARNRAARAGEIEAVERILDEEMARFLAWLRHRQLVPVARRLREALLADARLEVERHSRHSPAADREALERFSENLVNRILHRPLSHLRTLARDTPELIDRNLDPDALLLHAHLDADTRLHLVQP